VAGRVRAVSVNQRTAVDRWRAIGVPAGSADSPRDVRGDWFDASVPTTAAGALRAAGAWRFGSERAFDAEDWWWRTEVVGPGVLVFEGIATLAEIFVDGERALTSDNMFVGLELPVEPGAHELAIRCRALAPELAKKRPRPRWRVPMLEQQQLRWIRTTLLGRTPGWSPPAPAVGPWRPVWLDSRNVSVGAVALDARPDGDAGLVDVRAELDDAIDAASIVVTRGDERVVAALVRDGGTWRGTATLPRVARWWPHTHGEPTRYDVAIEASARGEAVTIDLGATGFRTIHVGREELWVRVNGVHVFCRGACWTPLDVVTLRSPGTAYRDAIAQARDAGMNMIRVGGTMVYEDDAFLDALDEAGILLWQDLMFANMDYPDEAAFVANVTREVDDQLARLQARPSVAIVCGNSEVEQQAAFWGAERARWSPPLFHEVLAARVAAAGLPYTPSSATCGAFPHAANAGPSSYYGVGAYLRPIDDARRAEVRFASECLAFANVPAPSGMPDGAALRVHHAAWKARTPRDLGAGWDFDDVRDHYVQRLYGVDPTALRMTDHDRYLALGRAATGEVMAQVFADWRRARSMTHGGLIWFLRDLWPGAGWGVVDANGAPKPAWYALRRALAPRALAITDEGVNGLAIHVFNDRPEPLDGELQVALYRSGDVNVGAAAKPMGVPPHTALEVAAGALFDGFLDISYAYRFGPPVAQIVHARMGDLEAFWFPAGLPSTREPDLGLAVAATADGDGAALVISTRRFAQSISIDAPGFAPDDDGFHIAPGGSRTVHLRRVAPGALRGTVSALNSEATARFEVR
jgi:beta-mannosidase